MIDTYQSLLELLSSMRQPGHSIQAIARSVVQQPMGKVCDFLIRAIREEDSDTKCEALDLLSRVVPLLAMMVALELLNEPEADLRRVACEILSEIGDTSCEHHLLKFLEAEQNGEVRFAAIAALRKTGTSISIPVLTALAETDSSTDFEGRPISELVPLVISRIKERSIPT
jgi:HEAT repeat protein